MKFYQYWEKIEKQVPQNDLSKTNKICSYGFSNKSPKDALECAKQRLYHLEMLINEEETWNYNNFETDIIREEIIQNIDSQNVISRNRYGAEILNTEQHLILDLDSWDYSYPDQNKLLTFFGFGEKGIEAMIRSVKYVAQKKYPHLKIRIYETKGGLRLFILDKKFINDEETIQLMNDFGCDKLYTQLCKNQKCCRARLTPKSIYLKMREHKCLWPRTPEKDIETQEWLKKYNERSSAFAVCKYHETIGKSPNPLPPIIQLHDDRTRANLNFPLS